MATQKELGTKAFQQKNFNEAIHFFTQAITESPHDHTLYSNRSACYYNLSQFAKAREDGEKCIEIKGDWGKGYQRKGMALHALGQYEEALQDYETGLKLDPENAQLKQSFEQCKKDKEQNAGAGAGAGAEEDGMFGSQAMLKLMSNPRIANYFKDPQFRAMFEFVKKDPQMLMQVMQKDPRFMDVFKELTGIDIMDMQSQ
jgi:stress-induced-phosphoprotein 1